MNKKNSIAYQIFQKNITHEKNLINKKIAENWLDSLFLWLFCNENECENFQLFENKETELTNQLELLISKSHTNYKNLVAIFFNSLLKMHNDLTNDLQAILSFDPAAKSRSEVLLTYPGFFAIFVYRIANLLWKLKINVLPRLLSEYAHSKTGIDIHPAANIGMQFFIDHGTGIVIGETAIIGNNVKIYQGVTLGALSVSKNKANKKRHPTIEDDVIIYANATILGGNTTICKGSVIGGNVWITDTIPPQSLVFNKTEIIVKTKIENNQILNFSI